MPVKRKKRPLETEENKGVFEKIGLKLGLIKPNKPSAREEQKEADAIISAGKMLRDRLLAVRCKSNKIPREKLERDQRLLMLYAQRLDDTWISKTADTRNIDEVLYKLCDELQTAYQKGDEMTAEYIMETIGYGINEGHKPLVERDKPRANEIMIDREKTIKTYLSITQAAENRFEVSDSIEKHTAKISDCIVRLKDQQKEVNDEKAANPLAYEKMLNIGAKMKNLDAETLLLATKMRNAVHTAKELEMLKKQVAILKAKVLQYETMIESFIITLNNPNEAAKEELNQYLKELSEEQLVTITKQVSDILDTENTINDMFASVDAAFQQPRVEDYIISALDEYEKLEYEIQEREEAQGRMMDKIQEEDLDELEY